MARYRIRFDFQDDPSTGDRIRIDSPSGTVLWSFEFYKQNESIPSLNPVEYVVGIKEATNYNFREAFRTGYNLSGQWIVENGSHITDITGELDSAPVLGEALPANCVWSVEELPDFLYIDSTTFLKNDANTCNKINLEIVGSHAFNELLAPYSEVFADTLSFTAISLDRGRVSNVGIKDSNGAIRYKQISTPGYLNFGLIDLEVSNNSLIVNDLTTGLSLEYSLNGTSWSTSGVFNNLSEGQYSLYIKDQFDCQIQTTFIIGVWDNGNIALPLEPYFEYPKSNCVRIAKREEWDNVTIFKNSENTLSCEAIDGVPYTERQRYNNLDSIPIQIKSNYSDLRVVTADDNIDQPLVQKTANIGVKSSMDCKIVDLGAGSFGVYFIAGKTYDYDTDADLLDDYVLNGELPQFAKVGNILQISNLSYAIESLTFNQDLELDQLVISSTELVGVTDAIVKSQYNIFTYEVYETNIDMSGKTEFNFQIWYDGAMQWASELLVADNSGGKLLHLKWWHKHNTDMFFATGIQPFMRRLVSVMPAGIKNSSENYETDSDVIQIESDNYEADLFTFEPMTKELAKLTILALSHSSVEINGIGYVKEDEPKLESMDDSNLYVVQMKMVIKGSGLYAEETDLSNTEIPALLTDGLGGYIKIN